MRRLLINLIALASISAFAQVKETYECVRDQGMEIIVNLHSKEGEKDSRTAEVLWRDEVIFEGIVERISNEKVIARTTDRNERIVFDFSDMTLQEYIATNNGLTIFFKNYRKTKKYKCVEINQ